MSEAVNVAALKQKIIEAGISGKLVPQIASEGTAEELLKQIEAERAALIKAGKIKKEKSLPEITDDEIPFEIPKSWKWVRIEDIFNVRSAMRIHQSDWKTSGIPFFRGRELVKLSKDGMVDFEVYISHELYEFCKMKGGVPQKNDILISAVGTIGKVYVVKGNREFYYKDAYILCLENIGKNNPYYVKYVLESTYLQQEIKRDSMATIVDQLTIMKAKSLCLPLPPLFEQKRIVAKIEDIITELDNIERLQLAYTANQDSLKKKIIEAGITGKLVPQIASEGTAEELLKQIEAERAALIKAGKIKKEKSLPEITEDEIPFEIPKSWKWVRLGEISNFGMNESINPDEISESDWILELEDIEKDSGKILVRKTKGERLSKSTKHRFTKGNVLYSKLRPYLNKVLVPNENGFCTSEIHVIDFGRYIIPEYAMFYLKSSAFMSYVNSCSYGVNMPRLGTMDGKLGVFPIPPLSEQKRIVAKIEELMQIIDKLKA